MFNPTLLAAVTLMLLLDNAPRLMVGYLLGALLTSVSVGLAIVFTLHDSGAVDTARTTISPLQDIVFGLLLLIVAYALWGDRGERRRERRRERKQAKAAKKEPKPSLPNRLLGRGSARVSFVVGIALSFPGASYLAALARIAEMKPGVPASVLLVVTFCVVQLALLEVPLLGYALSPDRTRDAVERFRAWLNANGFRAAVRTAAVLGGLLILRGVIEAV